jgi:hypothetical protein
MTPVRSLAAAAAAVALAAGPAALILTGGGAAAAPVPDRAHGPAAPGVVAAPATTTTLTPSPSPSPSPIADVFVEVNPGTAEPGRLVGIRASCTADNAEAATVESQAFGEVAVRPQFDFLTAAVTIPEGTEAARYEVILTCPDGETAVTSLRVLGVTRPSHGPATGFGGAAGDAGGTLLLAAGLGLVAAGAGLGVLRLRRRVGV